MNLDASSIPMSLGNKDASAWHLTDQFLVTALNSTISPTILPHVINLDHCHQVWQTLETHMNSSTRQHIIHLKNELHNIKKQDKSMQQYLHDVRIKVNALTAAGSSPESNDVILYILNGLPPSYDSFATVIKTRSGSISLDELYSLLHSEELILSA